MKYLFLALALAGVGAAEAAEPLKVTLGAMDDKGIIQDKYAYCKPTADGKSTPGQNVSPPISWSKGPEGTKSYAIIAIDPDVPAVFDDAGKEGKTLPADMKRQDFYHWVLVDISPSTTSLAEGADTATPAPKPAGKTPNGIRGVNDYGKFMGDGKTYGGYDGPCPPWNDERVHHYHFNVYALDVETLGLGDATTGQMAMSAIKSHTLAQGEAVGTYTLNKALRK